MHPWGWRDGKGRGQPRAGLAGFWEEAPRTRGMLCPTGGTLDGEVSLSEFRRCSHPSPSPGKEELDEQREFCRALPSPSSAEPPRGKRGGDFFFVLRWMKTSATLEAPAIFSLSLGPKMCYFKSVEQPSPGRGAITCHCCLIWKLFETKPPRALP